ncbi:MAG: ABC transporter substrate-binding protein [Caldilineaceae bacterium]
MHLSAVTGVGVLVSACGGGGSAPAPADAPAVEQLPAAEAAKPAVPAGPPSSYNEAPMLAELVAKGELPPVDQRLPKNPLVLDVVEEIGQYGGTWRRAYKGVSDRWGPNKVVGEFLLEWRQPEGGELSIVPQIAESYEVNDDGTEYTWHLREGMNWSDGQPLTTEDVRFWWEDLYMNEEAELMVGGNDNTLMPGGEKMQIEIVDDYTFKSKFAAPNALLTINIARGSGCHGSRGPNFCTPAHYMKQFHPKYAAEEELQAALDKYEMESWEQLMESYNSPAVFWFLNPDVPTVTAWITTVAPPADRISMERNPYYFSVDPAGNQLPYIDTVTHDLFDDTEVLNFKIINGEIDCQNRHVEIGNFTLFKENEEKGDYRVLIWNDAATFAYHPNMAYAQDPVLQALFNDVRFRHALSVAIDRDEINNLVFSGLAEPRQGCPVSGSPQYDAEWETKWIEYDPEMANQLLDEIGLTERGADGFRLRSDGETLSVVIEYATASFAGPNDMHELVKEYWENVGVKVSLNPVERSLYEAHDEANELQIGSWVVDRSAVIPADPGWYLGSQAGGGYTDWFETNGAEGVEPPADHPLRQAWALWDEIKVTADEAQRNELVKQLMDLNKEQLWSIGIVGEPPALFIAKNNFRNVPAGLINDDPLRAIGLAQPPQFFFKQA